MTRNDYRGRLLALALGGCLISACDSNGPAGESSGAHPAHGASDRPDPHSWARPARSRVEHLALDVTVDFDTRRIVGRASLRLANAPDARELWLDTRDLDIRSVGVGPEVTPVDFELTESQPHLGRGLRIPIEPSTEWVHVDYSSRPEAYALQWLDPPQTAGGRRPFLLSQSQSIFARTWIPCQDSPGIRMTYDATVRVPEGLMALMSASNPTETSPDGVYRFRMEQPIPAYLLALAVGDLEFRAFDERSGVYAESEVIERAAWEFAETPEMIDLAESLYGPYRWERYDVIVLPPSFPFGGMENPRLTFVTPTVIAGDRSLVSLIAHELAHSWSGNLVTNATWNDFWLNEGFTVYFERRIMEALEGRDYADMLALIGRGDLDDTLSELGAGAADSHLKLDLGGRDADEGMTDVAYEKGYLLLRLLEEHVGRERFDTFLRQWFESNAFRSVTTEQFLARLREGLDLDEATLARLQIDAWVYGPGVPSNEPAIASDAFLNVDAQLAAWTAGTPATRLEVDGWSSHQWQYFIRSLPSDVDGDRMSELDDAFALTASGNSEVLHAWLMQAIATGYAPADPAIDRFLSSMGRRKFLKPLYTALAARPGGMERARAIYRRNRDGYHPLATGTIDEILAWDEVAAGG